MKCPFSEELNSAFSKMGELITRTAFYREMGAEIQELPLNMED
jgi:hypothetical protein